MARNAVAEIIIDELLERDWSISDVIIHAGKTKNPEYGIAFLALQMYLVLDESETGMRLGAELIADLSKAFGTSEEFFKNLENAWVRETGKAKP